MDLLCAVRNSKEKVLNNYITDPPWPRAGENIMVCFV